MKKFDVVMLGEANVEVERMFFSGTLTKRGLAKKLGLKANRLNIMTTETGVEVYSAGGQLMALMVPVGK